VRGFVCNVRLLYPTLVLNGLQKFIDSAFLDAAVYGAETVEITLDPRAEARRGLRHVSRVAIIWFGLCVLLPGSSCRPAPQQTEACEVRGESIEQAFPSCCDKKEI